MVTFGFRKIPAWGEWEWLVTWRGQGWPPGQGDLLQPSPEAITVCTEGLNVVGLVNSVQWNAVT